MKKRYELSHLLFFLTNFFILTSIPRSPHRPLDPQDPIITAYWQDNPLTKHEFRDAHLQEALFQLFDEDYFFNHLLPNGPINFRYEPEKSVSTQELGQIIEELILEIQGLKKRQKKIQFKKFNILKKRDVNKRNHTGLYVVEFKDYPFILKLFIETPEGIVNPTDKGFEPICFYYLAGLSRHFNGFSRIKNLENIKNIVQANPYWSTKVDFPRKWFWLPKNSRWITIKGKNIGTEKESMTTIPSIYGIICDKIVWEKPFCLTDAHDRNEAMELSNFLGQRIDSHINNFGIEIQSDKIVPIDFEHFITAVGIEEGYICENYIDWYMHLTFKMMKRLLFQNKQERRYAQYRPFKPLV
jgi:hypothetical protein